MEKIVSVNHISKRYHTQNGETNALYDVSFEVYDGEFVSIVGPSGCGKSTLLSIIAGLILPTSGEIVFSGEDCGDTASYMGYMLQRDCLFEWRTILQNTMLGLEISGKTTQENKERVLGLLNTYGLYDFRNSFPSQLSGGMRQRVALIRTLAVNPRILLLDEAFSALDYQTRLAVTDDIYTIIKRENKTAILITHDIAESISMSDRVLVMSKRPGTIKGIFPINFQLEGRTPVKSRKAVEFSSYFNDIWRELDVHV